MSANDRLLMDYLIKTQPDQAQEHLIRRSLAKDISIPQLLTQTTREMKFLGRDLRTENPMKGMALSWKIGMVDLRSHLLVSEIAGLNQPNSGKRVANDLLVAVASRRRDPDIGAIAMLRCGAPGVAPSVVMPVLFQILMSDDDDDVNSAFASLAMCEMQSLSGELSQHQRMADSYLSYFSNSVMPGGDEGGRRPQLRARLLLALAAR